MKQKKNKHHVGGRVKKTTRSLRVPLPPMCHSGFDASIGARAGADTFVFAGGRSQRCALRAACCPRATATSNPCRWLQDCFQHALQLSHLLFHGSFGPLDAVLQLVAQRISVHLYLTVKSALHVHVCERQ
jgi:hypothetical protein